MEIEDKSRLLYTDTDIVFREIPDEMTLAINISGCPNACVGCHSPHLQQNIGNPLTEEALESLISPYRKHITCVCFMGGDGQTQEIEQRGLFIKQHYEGKIKSAWYSGKAELPKDFSLEAMNYIKLGPYMAQCGSLDNPSTNQRLYRVSNEGEMQDITSSFWK